MPPHLIIMDKVVLLGVIILKMKCVCKTQMMHPPDHQNPVDMHTSIMCINILQNIKAVAPKLQEEIAEQTMYLYPDGRTDGRTNGRTGGKLISPPPTLRRGGIKRRPVFDNIKFIRTSLYISKCMDYAIIIKPGKYF